MNTVILFAAVGFVYGLRVASKGNITLANYIQGGALCSLIGGVLGLLGGVIIGTLVPSTDVVYGPVRLVAMRSSESISGTFIWGSGSIGSHTSYNFMRRMEDGSMVPGSVPADGLVRLIEDPELHNTGFWTTTISEADKTSPLYHWAVGLNDKRQVLRQEFRVPVGTVIQQFNIK